ncbi:hypothetical protein [Xanthobacter pseudotagetidis]|uniref:hypothetical protein n=1 Tax=Xanthobacter pseudotagetidis TaxID=3119911 RepID=UPI00372C59AE
MKIAAVAALAIFLAASGLSAQAQQMPAELVGVWAPDGVSCDLPDDDVDGEFPYLIVATNGYAGHEATCRLASAGPPIRPSEPIRVSAEIPLRGGRPQAVFAFI